ncbi:MAG: insulinase family protein [Ignavibacteria bacterium]|jgi:zinc protease|nr:insulinase family protein [Ignavibacteria bacterium]MCU7501688.1 insulinase family protein [Ignavibacteria bacterium]MCU7516905.1 insulinase family protein [Ignavibacteria bacterium]
MKENLVLLPVKNDPTVSFKIWFNAGSEYDPKGKEGLAYITARLISEGATLHNSYEEILEKLFPLASGYSASASVEMTVYSGRVHKDNLEVYYPLFLDGIIRPKFSEQDFDRIKDETLNYLTTTLKYSSDEDLGKTVLYDFIFENTPYGHSEQGTISGVRNITLDDVRNFYQTYYNRNNFVLGIAGGYSKKLAERLQKDLSALPEGTRQNFPDINYEPIKGLNVKMINKDAQATAISFGFPINLKRGEKDWYALAVANSWLGEHRNSSSHLYQVIREARGLNYGDYSYIENFPNGGQLQMPPVNVARRQQIFEVWIRPVPNETRHFVLRSALREIKNFIDNGLTREEFELTRKFLKNYVLHYAPETEMRLGYALDDKFYGLQNSHLETFRKMMDQLSLEDVNNAIKKYLNYGNMKIAIITKDAESFKSALENNTTSPITYSTPKADKVYEEDKEIQDYKLDIPAGNIKIIGVEELFK